MNDDLMHDLFGNGGVRIALIGALAILALFLFAETVSIAKNFDRPASPATDTITVTGDGQATLPPDIATVSFSVENTAPAVADAQAATTKQANAALASVSAQGVAAADVTTSSYNISPQYSYPTCGSGAFCPASAPKITGYTVSETIQVKIRDLSKVGTILGGLGTLGVQNVSGPNFTLDDTSAGYDAARADAIMKAKAQATLLAKQLGISLGKIVNFSESSGGYSPVLYSMTASAGAASAPVPSVPAGSNTYSASVSVTYEIR